MEWYGFGMGPSADVSQPAWLRVVDEASIDLQTSWAR